MSNEQSTERSVLALILECPTVSRNLDELGMILYFQQTVLTSPIFRSKSYPEYLYLGGRPSRVRFGVTVRLAHFKIYTKRLVRVEVRVG